MPTLFVKKNKHIFIVIYPLWPIRLNRLESPIPTNTLCQVEILAQWFWRRF